MADKTAQTIFIDADPRTVMDVIADIGSYPQWVSEYTETEVLETDAEGLSHDRPTGAGGRSAAGHHGARL